MAKPRIFVSSTYYDLKHIRASLDVFIESLGYEAVLSEKGEVAYAHDLPLDESCYAEVRNADILVLVIGGRYGSAASSDVSALPQKFHERYESITKMEYQAAIDNGTASYILIEAAVLAEYRTYQKNKENQGVIYAHVDSVNVFRLIEEVLSKRKGNPVQQFEKYGDIEGWLREQWAGLFRDMLRKSTGSQQLTSLKAEVSTLHQVTDTLKTYLESMMKTQGPGFDDLIIAEHRRLKAAKEIEDLRGRSSLFNYVHNRVKADWVEGLLEVVKTAKTEGAFLDAIVLHAADDNSKEQLLDTLIEHKHAAWIDVMKIRESLGISPLSFEEWLGNQGNAQSEEKPKGRRIKKSGTENPSG